MKLQIPVIGKVAALQFYQLMRFSMVFLISILLSKSGLSTAAIGHYEYFLFLAGLVSFFWISGLINSFLALYNQYPKAEKNPVYFSASILLLFFSFLAGLVLFILMKTDAGGIRPDLHGFEILLLLYVILSGPAALVENFYLVRNDSKKIIRYAWISLPLQVLAVGIPVFAGFGIESAFIGLISGMLVRIIWLILFLIKHSRFQFDSSFSSQLMKNGWPLMLVALLGGSTQYIDGAIITAYFDPQTFAVFRYGARELPLVILFANAFSNAMVPSFSGHTDIRIPLQEIRQKTVRMMHFLYPLSFALLLSSSWLYPRVFNPEFAGGAAIFNIYLLLISSKLVFPQTILLGQRKNIFLMTVSIILTIAHFLLALIMVQVSGITGVAFTAVIINLIEKIIFFIYLKQKEGISLQKYLDIRWWLLYNGILAGLFILSLRNAGL